MASGMRLRKGDEVMVITGKDRGKRGRVQEVRPRDQTVIVAGVKDELRKQFSYGNVMQIPKVDKIVLNIGMGEAIGNAKAMDAAAGDLAKITGQRPIVTKSKKAISNFRLRVGMPIGLKVTLRGERMWHFLEKLVTVA